MPKVIGKNGGSKQFPYTKKGEKAASSYAKKTGGKEVIQKGKARNGALKGDYP